MKKFFSVIAIIFFIAAGLFAETKITEKQIENFVEKGNYLKIITKDFQNSPLVIYYLKQNISCIIIYPDSTKFIIQDLQGKNVEYLDLDEYEVYFEKDNMILIKLK